MIRKTFSVVFFCTALSALPQSPRQVPGRPQWNNNGILVNHFGFAAVTAEFCMVRIDTDVDVEVVYAADGKQGLAGAFEEDALYTAEVRCMVSECRTHGGLNRN